jgi:hypothetical protein
MSSSLREYRPYLLEILPITVFAGLMIFGLNACKTPADHSLSLHVSESLYLSNADYLKIVEKSLLHWSPEDQNGQYAYTLDPENARLGTTVPTSLGHVIASQPDAMPENNFVIYIDEVVVPEPDYAFITIRTTNRYEATEFALVFERNENAWQVRDYFLIAEGLLNTTLLNFSWEVYKAGISESRPSH